MRWPPELNRESCNALHSALISGCRNGAAQGLTFSDSNMSCNALGLGTAAAGPGFIHNQNCGRQTGESAG
ncbi:snorna binding protein [Moniliophthora roreri]|nr:snorna binding protein [Moniliophthora roreri]